MTQEVSPLEIIDTIEKALGKFPGAHLLARGIWQVMHDAGFKVIRRTSEEMRHEMTGR